jgi:hypothetical protein
VGDFHIKKIILPSGKAVEIVYFDALLEAVDATRAEVKASQALGLDPGPSLEVCPLCESNLVYPLDWREADGDRWELELRCPCCEWRHRDTFDQETVERFDDALNAATDSLIGSLDELSRENMRAEIDRFVDALAHDHILPFDF